MATRLWRSILIGGTVLALVSVCLGPIAQGAVLLLSMLVAVGLILFGVKTHRPNEKGPWVTLAVSVALLLLAGALRLFEIGTSFYISAPDLVTMSGYVGIIYASERLGRLRSHDFDPTNLLDSIVFTLATAVVLWGVFMLQLLKLDTVSLNDRVSFGAFAVLDSLIFFVAAKLGVGPGARTKSFYLLAAAAGFVLASDLFIDADIASANLPGLSQMALLLPTLGMLCCGAAAVHPSMVEITKPAVAQIARVTRGRLAMTTAAVIVPPVVLVWQFWRTDDWAYLQVLGPVCVVLTVLVMLRFGGLVQARERLSVISGTLIRAAASLVSSTDRSSIYEAAVTATRELVDDKDNLLFVAVLSLKDGVWEPAREHKTVDRSATDSALAALLARFNRFGTNSTPVLFAAEEQRSASSVLAAPLISQNMLRGALVVGTRAGVHVTVESGIESLAADVSLALEAVALSEDLHRQRSDRRFRALIDNSPELIVVLNEEHGITFLSPLAERFMAKRSGDVRALLAAAHPEDRLALLALIEHAAKPGAAGYSVECRFVDAEEEARWFEVTANDMRGVVEVDGLVLNGHDINDRKALEDDLRHQVLHDDLTGIANRALFKDRVQHALTRRSQSEVGPCVIFIDLDDFKNVNDVYGHGTGDELLKVIAFRLKAFLREHDTAARLGGDEFAVLLPTVESHEQAEAIAMRLLDVIREPFDLALVSIKVGASIGVAFAQSATDAEVLLRNADVAMYGAKSAGKARIQLFDDAMYLAAMDRLEITSDLAHAIEKNELILYYQPLVDMETRMLTGFEALLRWNHPTRGFVSPLAFIPIAESTGLINQIGEWVIHESFQQAKVWNTHRADNPLKVSVNVSPYQLLERSLAPMVSAAMSQHQVDPSWVTLELTETAVLEQSEIKDRVTELRSLGVGIAADDFGSGFASYAALAQLPFTIVKIDRSLIQHLPDQSGVAEAQVRSIVEMSHAMDLIVVVEGIEQENQYEVLAALGCDRGQGYLFGRPMPAPDAASLVTTEMVTLKSLK